jgi:hypothetical protein
MQDIEKQIARILIRLSISAYDKLDEVKLEPYVAELLSLLTTLGEEKRRQGQKDIIHGITDARIIGFLKSTIDSHKGEPIGVNYLGSAAKRVRNGLIGIFYDQFKL